jgi:GINS complex subunit 3
MFRNRLVEIIDKAQHFAALGPAMAGAGGQSGKAALIFKEGLKVTERDRGFSIIVSSSETGRLIPD